MTTTQKMMIGFISGLTIGLLYAPCSGRKTRNKLGNLGYSLKNHWNEMTDDLANRIDTVRNSVDNIADKAIAKVENTQFETNQWRDV